MANAVICPETGKSLKHQELITKLRYKIKCMKSTANKINRLFNKNTIRFIRRSDIPKGRKVTYGSFVVDIKDHKDEERTRLTIGGDQIEYPGGKFTRTAGLATATILINSVISTPSAKFLVIRQKSLLEHPAWKIRIYGHQFGIAPSKTIEKYDLNELAQDGKVYIEIQKGMYGLPQADILTNELLQRNLAKDGYRPTTHTRGLWTHDTHPISFSLVVDDFGVKCVGREHAEHLMTCISKKYNISSDWDGTAYCGLTLDWDYKNTQSTYICQDTSKPHSINTNILPQHDQNTHHIHGIHPFMAPKRNL
jgi:ssDNA-binding Zn-finger/Zn-ribbon topoisomerase 1